MFDIEYDYFCISSTVKENSRGHCIAYYTLLKNAFCSSFHSL